MNVLLKEVNGRFVAKLTDFGLSKSKISKQSKSTAGTLAYKPPESGEEELSGAVDVFAFGGVLIYLFGDSHVHPFENLTDDAIVKKMVRCYEHGKPLVVPELDDISIPEIREIASQCLSARSGSRPTVHALIGRFSKLCGISGDSQVSYAAEDVMVKIQMRTLNILMEEVTSLKEMMRFKNIEISDLETQMEFLQDEYIEGI